jgi:hypothetical protein
MPKAINAADLSSETVLAWISGCLVNAMEIGAHLDPGDKIAFLMPFLAQRETRSRMG